MKCEAKTEKEMREAEVPIIETKEDLMEYIDSLVDREHDYGTAVYAMSMAAVAAYNYVAHKEGVTGFQASCADLDIVKRNRGLKHGFMLLNFEHLLYPQYLDGEHFPTWRELITKNAKWLKDEATKMLNDRQGAHPEVIDHWKNLAAMEIKEG